MYQHGAAPENVSYIGTVCHEPPDLRELPYHRGRGEPVLKRLKFSNKPVKLLFLTPEAKAAILDKPENPFQWAYVIDGEVSTVEGEPALYKIAAVHEAIERP